MRRLPRATVPALAAATGSALVLLLSSCASTPEPAVTGSSDAVQVVASTNVYGDIVEAIGGDAVSVTSIISRTSQDPHSYEVTAQDKLAVSKAALVVGNGGGYDEFLHSLADEAGLTGDRFIEAVEISGLAPEEEAGAETEAAGGEHHHDHGEFNEHVWYSFAAMSAVADAVATELGEIKPDAAGTFDANATAFKDSLAGLTGQLDALAAGSAGKGVLMTEPVPFYLLEAAGLENVTPADYSSAIEEGNDVPPATLQEATRLAGSPDIAFLAYNQQTEGPQTQAVKQAAEAAGVPVVNFSETLPEGAGYLAWMTDNVQNVKEVLESK